MIVSFTKAVACGNDFLIVDGSFASADIAVLTQHLCDRHNGIGADGVEWLYPAEGADVHARLINADGSEAEISGNGTRCVAAYLCNERGGESFLIRTGAGTKTCTLTARAGNRYDFEIVMGKPEVRPEQVIRISTGEVRGIPVSMGNPHYVVFVDEFPADWQRLAAEIQRDRSFPQGVNIEFVRAHAPGSHSSDSPRSGVEASALTRPAAVPTASSPSHHIEVRFYERGVGETQSSGTGSSASAAAAISVGKAQSPVRIETPGGLQVVRWDEELFLRGSADLICRGEFFA